MALLDRVKIRTGSDLDDSELQAMIDEFDKDQDGASTFLTFQISILSS